LVGWEDELGRVGTGGVKKWPKKPDFGGPKNGLGDRQVGAFSDFRARHTGGPFIFRPKSPFLRKICRFRG